VHRPAFLNDAGHQHPAFDIICTSSALPWNRLFKRKIHFTSRRTFMKVNLSLFKTVGVSILFIVGSSQAFAQSPQMTQKQQDQTVRQQQTGQQGMQQSQNLVGKKVTTQSGGMLGTVEEVIQDSSGNERYAMLSRGQGGRKAITVPLQRINQQGQGDALTANVDLSSLQQLTRRQGQQQQSEPEKALDQILGQNVQGQQGEKLGTINNIVIGTEGGPMVVMQGENQSNYPIPLQALQQQQGQQGFRIDQDKQNFQTAPSYRDKFIDLRQWRDVIYAYYGLESQQVAQQSQQQRQPQVTQRSQQQRPAPSGTATAAISTTGERRYNGAAACTSGPGAATATPSTGTAGATGDRGKATAA
jgi:sporulation protein YlmC with PRC-barrel domain